MVTSGTTGGAKTSASAGLIDRILNGSGPLDASDISALMAIAGFIALLWQLWSLARQTRYQQQVNRAEMFMHLSEKWTSVLDFRYKLLNSPTKATVEDIAAHHGSPQKLFQDDIWKNMRPVLNFYESLGLMIHQRYVSPEEAFVLITVDGPCEEGKSNFYTKARPYLDYLRAHYRPDIYIFYDKALIPVYQAYMAKPFQPRPPAWPIGPRISYSLGRMRNRIQRLSTTGNIAS